MTTFKMLFEKTSRISSIGFGEKSASNVLMFWKVLVVEVI